MLSEHTATLEEVAAAIGRDPAWLKRHWRRLTSRNGFPAPLPGSKWCWSRQLVLLWIANAPARPVADNENAPSPQPADAGGSNDLVRAQHASLTARYGGQP
jgi:hypothetical protein